MRLIAIGLTLVGLALMGQTWADAQDGHGILPTWMETPISAVLPGCPSAETGNWCYWHGRTGSDGPFFVAGDVVIIFY